MKLKSEFDTPEWDKSHLNTESCTMKSNGYPTA